MSGKSSHPPIPPNCEDWMRSRDGDVEVYITDPHGWVAARHADIAPWAAARAEVAWLEKDDYWHDEHLDTTDDNAEKKIMEKRNECMRNAAAWREWGKGEWKP